MASKTCPKCGKDVRQENPKCWNCGHDFLPTRAVKKQADISPAVGCPLALILLIFCGYMLWLLVSSIMADWRSSPRQLEPQVSREETVATLINLSGNLCAKVTLISPRLSSGEYQVNCEEYRDPTKSGTKHNTIIYLVNPDSGTVRLMGRV